MVESGNVADNIDMKLKNPPIVEAVIDFDCDMPPGFDLAGIESKCRESFQDKYPEFRALYLEKHQFAPLEGKPSVHSTNRSVQALQFLQNDHKQLVQVRTQGYSFNRLAPYTSLDDYLPEIERTWLLFLQIASPIQVRVVRLRYINRILLPMAEEGVKLEEYIPVLPHPADEKLRLTGFLSQYTAKEMGTNHEVTVVLTSHPPEKDHLPIILDNCVGCSAKTGPEDWAWIFTKIQALRELKNRVFEKTLTPVCLSLFQQ